MKTKLLFFGMVLSMNLTFGQAILNQSVGNVQGFFSSPLTPAFPVTGLPAQFSEIFRFRTGFVGQIDAGTGYGFTNDRWFSLGRVTIPAASQNFYGLRFQMPNRGLVMGYNTLTATNPVIQWIGTGSNLGNLEFRVANTFGAVGTAGSDVLVATMTKDGNTVFGNVVNPSLNTKVTIDNSGEIGLQINSSNNVTNKLGLNIRQITTGNTANLGAFIGCQGALTTNTGVRATANGGLDAIGISGEATGTKQNFGIKATVTGDGTFEAAIFAESFGGNNNQWAGFFDGEVFTSAATYQTSDAKLKENVKSETNVLEKLSLLNPVTYNYKEITEMNLPNNNQHGFISQELAIVFPELTRDISKPVFDKEGKTKTMFELKAVNYTGLISVLTAGINELNTELKSVKQELAELKSASKITNANNQGFFMEQNIPNPFADQTVIRYQLPNGTTTAEIAVFDMTGKPVKSFVVNSSQKEITIKSSEIGTGLFIYSLV